MGCTAQVWLTVERQADDTVTVAAHSDSEVSKGLAAVLVEIFSGADLEQITAVSLEELDSLQLGTALASPSRTNAFRNMLSTLQQRARALFGDLPRFPSLLVTSDTLTPEGAFAEAQAQFLQPDEEQVQRLAGLLRSKQIGVVAHFYMDPEVQGVLTSAAAHWEHIGISGAQALAKSVSSMSCLGAHMPPFLRYMPTTAMLARLSSTGSVVQTHS